MNTSRGVNRYIHLFPQMPYGLDVIRMIVRYKYGTYTFHQNIEIFQCFLDGTDADIHKKEDNYREDFFFLSMDSVIFANNSKAMAAISPIAAK